MAEDNILGPVSLQGWDMSANLAFQDEEYEQEYLDHHSRKHLPSDMWGLVIHSMISILTVNKFRRDKEELGHVWLMVVDLAAILGLLWLAWCRKETFTRYRTPLLVGRLAVALMCAKFVPNPRHNHWQNFVLLILFKAKLFQLSYMTGFQLVFKRQVFMQLLLLGIALLGNSELCNCFIDDPRGHGLRMEKLALVMAITVTWPADTPLPMTAFGTCSTVLIVLQMSVAGLQLLLLYDWEHRSRLLFMQQFMVERLSQRPPPLEVPLSYGFAASLVLSQLCLSAAPGALATFYITPANGTVATNATAAVTAMLAGTL